MMHGQRIIKCNVLFSQMFILEYASSEWSWLWRQRCVVAELETHVLGPRASWCRLLIKYFPHGRNSPGSPILAFAVLLRMAFWRERTPYRDREQQASSWGAPGVTSGHTAAATCVTFVYDVSCQGNRSVSGSTLRLESPSAAVLTLFQVGTTFISQNVLRTTLLLGLSNSLGLP